ncbi:unnamed protein product [Lampetra fluviatilis]
MNPYTRRDGRAAHSMRGVHGPQARRQARISRRRSRISAPTPASQAKTNDLRREVQSGGRGIELGGGNPSWRLIPPDAPDCPALPCRLYRVVSADTCVRAHARNIQPRR